MDRERGCAATHEFLRAKASEAMAAIVAGMLVLVLMGAFQASLSLDDLWMMLAVGVIALIMKALDWPRPPLLLGFILGEIIGRPLAGPKMLCVLSISTCASACASIDSGRCTAIWSPSKSALKPPQTSG